MKAIVNFPAVCFYEEQADLPHIMISNQLIANICNCLVAKKKKGKIYEGFA